MSNLFSSSQSTSSKNTYTPNSATTSLFNPIFSQLQQQVGQPFTPYTGQLSAGMTADQTGARGLLDPMAGSGATGTAIGAAQGLLGYTPNQITAPGILASQAGAPSTYQAQQAGAATAGPAAMTTATGYTPYTGTAVQAGPASLAGAQGYQAQMAQGAQAGPASLTSAASINRSDVRNVSPSTIASGMGMYQNPYENQVVQSALNDLDLQRQRSITNQAGGFTQAGAFGGSRQGVADSLTNEAAIREAGMLSGNLRSQGFNTAAGLSSQDASNRLNAGLANQNVDLSVAGQNAGYRQQAGLANQNATNSRAEFDAGLLQNTGQFNANAGNTAAQFGAGAQNTANLTNAGLLNNNAQYNAGLLAQSNQANMDAMNRGAEFTAGAQNTANLTNAGAMNNRDQFNAGLLSNMAQFNTGATNDAARYGADAANNNAQFNASLRQNTNQFNAGNDLAAQQANQSAGLTANSQNLTGAGLLGDLGQQQQAMNINGASALNSFGTQEQELQQANLERAYQEFLRQQGYNQQQIGNQLGLLGSIPTMYAGATTKGKQTTTSTPSTASMAGSALQIASLFSDRRLKTGITPLGQRGEHNWYRYRYVWDAPDVTREGVMADEVMHTGAVSVHPSGYLMVDYGAL